MQTTFTETSETRDSTGAAVGCETPAFDLKSISDEALDLAYLQVRASAERLMSRGFFSDSYCETELVNEAFMRMLRYTPDKSYASPRHLLNSATVVMYRILCERFRRRRLRGGNAAYWPEEHGAESDVRWLIEFNDELSELEKKRPRSAEVLRLKGFFAFTLREIGEVLDCSINEAYQELVFARVFLKRRMAR